STWAGEQRRLDADMKAQLAKFALIVVLSLWTAWSVLLVVGTPGCTTTQQQVQYRSLKAVALTVDAALKVYSDAVVAGKVGGDTQAKVLDAKARYADAMTSAIASAKASTSPAPQALQQLADSLVAVLQAATRPGGAP